MIWPTFQDVELPLMNHFVGQCVDDFLFAILASLERLLEQRKREANFALGRWAKTVLIQPWPWASTTHEQADRGGQPAAPDELDRGQQACEVASIQFTPHVGQLLRGHPNSSYTAAASNGTMISWWPIRE